MAVPVACDAVAAAANSPLVASAVELSRPEPGGPIRIGVLLEGSADGVAARAMRMAGLLGPAETSLDAAALVARRARRPTGRDAGPRLLLGVGAADGA